MALHKNFPTSPHEIIDPDHRWFPADEALRENSMEKLMPPLVPSLRRKVKQFRDSGYVGASDTSKSLLKWWFETPHFIPDINGALVNFQYYFAQQEAMETIIYLYDVVGAKDKYDLMRFDVSGSISASMFDESWRRYVIKMATGSGKTKVMSLALAWSFFHKCYEESSTLSRNFLVITPNIIVLDRIYKDFQGLRIFFKDPVLPDNGYNGRNWRDDFQLTLHLQDAVRVIRPVGNIFLTNIHRIYSGEDLPPGPDDDNTMDYFLGKRPTGATTDSKVDLGMIVRDIQELMILNDEAHHIHDARLAWFKSIADIHNRLLQKERYLSFQLDVTATPKHNNGAIFVQTVADYPLVEAISQNVVKHPVLPDADSRTRLSEHQSSKFTEKYADYLELGVIEWRKAFDAHKKFGKKAILFVMTDDTRNCDDVAYYLETRYPELKQSVLTIQTKNNGDISEVATGKKKEELENLRKQANDIDKESNPYKAIVSVIMLKEGWDVRNVTTIVGLRAYSAKSNILPEQTLGRGLRRMYQGDTVEYVSVIGTQAFMNFVESIQAEGVELERKAMGEGTAPKTAMIIEIDHDNPSKNIDHLDIELPIMTPRMYREYQDLANLEINSISFQKIQLQQFTEDDHRKIVFRDITSGKISHITELDRSGMLDYRSVIGYFTKAVMKELRLVSGYDILYGKMKLFIQSRLFGQSVDLSDTNTIRNLAEITVIKTVIEIFKKAVNNLTIKDKGKTEIRERIKMQQTRPFMVKDQPYMLPRKSVFNKIVGDSQFELQFASFLENCNDVVSYVKNYFAVSFKLDYITANGDIANYYPDFLVRISEKKVVVVETKGRKDLDVPPKMERLNQWCEDINAIQTTTFFDFVFVDEAGFHQYKPNNFESLLKGFTEFKNG